MKKCWQIFFGVLAIVLAMLACGQPAEEWQLRGWTVTPSLTSTVANTPTLVLATQTPFIGEITSTPQPTAEVLAKCISADVAVHLRPSPSTENYPIEALANGIEVKDLGGRSGKWWFVVVGDKQGWVDSNYLGECG
jgi:hypothetical protein